MKRKKLGRKDSVKKRPPKKKSQASFLDELGLTFEDDNGVVYVSEGVDTETGELILVPVEDSSGNLLS